MLAPSFPPATVLPALIAALVALPLAGFAVLCWRQQLLVRLAARDISRRRGRALLTICGMALATTVIVNALGTGDTIAHTLRALVTARTGTVDEIVLLNPLRLGPVERIGLLTESNFGGYPAAERGLFPQGEFARIREATQGSAAIAQIVPAIADQVTAIYGEPRQLRAAVPLLALETPGAAFGPFEALDGTPIHLESLARDEIVLNAAAAETFGVAGGASLQLRMEGGPSGGWPVRVASIARNGGVGGAQPLVLAPLARYQEVAGHLGQINQVLVANRGGPSSADRAASEELRVLLVDRSQAGRLHAALAHPEARRVLLAAEGRATGREREDLAALRREVARPDLTDRFIGLAAEWRTRKRLVSLSEEMRDPEIRRAVFGSLFDLATLTVTEPRREGLDEANDYDAATTVVFLVLGTFVMAAAAFLIHLLFTLLAADRGAELATLRTLGSPRRQIAGLLLVEGFAYALAGTALGALAGLGALRLTVAALRGTSSRFGFAVAPHIEPRSFLAATVGGLLLTVGIMGFAAWRVSAASLVNAQDELGTVGRARYLLPLGALLILPVGVRVWGWRGPLVAPAALSCVLLAAVGALSALPRRHLSTTWRDGGRAGWLETAGRLTLAWVWLQTLASLPTRGGQVPTDIITAVAGGLALLLAAVWTGVRGLGPLLAGFDRRLSGLAGLSRIRVVVLPAVSALGRRRWRTGLTAMMFGTIVFTAVAALTLIATLTDAYAGPRVAVAGFDLRADRWGIEAGDRVQGLDDIGASLGDAGGISRGTFGAIGGLARQGVRIVAINRRPVPSREAPLAIADDGFLRGVAPGVARRAPGYDSDAAIWDTLGRRPGTAVITDDARRAVLGTRGESSGEMLLPVTVEARPFDGGQAIELTVIGVLDARVDLDPGLYVSRGTAAGLDVPLPTPSTWFLAVPPEARPREAAEGLRMAFADRGLVVTVLGDQQRLGRAVQGLLTRLVAGSLGVGLLAGVAALVVLSVQSALERRPQLGLLRALGCIHRQTAAILAVESTTIAALGIALGMALGLTLARVIVFVLLLGNPEIRYVVPWEQIAATLLLTWLGTLATLGLAAWQAKRVSPADALRAT